MGYCCTINIRFCYPVSLIIVLYMGLVSSVDLSLDITLRVTMAFVLVFLDTSSCLRFF